jgi:deoxyribodipyrimidine photo-lyase
LTTTIVWFRRDARLDDNPALTAAVGEGRVCPLFVVDPTLWDRASPARRSLLAAGLADLDRSISGHGGRLRVERGDPVEVVPAVAGDVSAVAVHVNAEVTPYGAARDRLVAERCRMVEHHGVYARSPGSVLTNNGEPYKVFTPFFDRWLDGGFFSEPAPAEARFTDEPGAGVPEHEEPPFPAGSASSRQRLAEFLSRVDRYQEERDRLDLDSTSHLSVDLKYGWIGVRSLINEVGTSSPGRRAFVRQVAWRDFYGHLMAATPDMATRPLDRRFEAMAWRNDAAEIEAWKTGQTGYPIVDAAMRRLVAEGRMHNRARLIAASFLVKDLLVDWRIGERFFRHHLIDGDVAQNVGNWQWVAGTGTDAAPYFRVFNPVIQSKRFDPEGGHMRRWVPELARVPDDLIHSPWMAGPLELIGHGVDLGRNYPEPIVDHAVARERAISAYESARGSR